MISRSGIIVAGLCAMLVATMAATLSAEEQPEEGFISMFNGKDLSGWEGSPGWWQVRDGLLVAESTPEKLCERSHYLYWQGGQPQDFEMRASYRITGDANSGIQFRSETQPQWDTWGYQADLDSAGKYTGCLYQHDRGLVAQRGERVHIDADGDRTVTPIGDSDELLRGIRPNDWNDYRIRAAGTSITLWINDVRMCEVEDHQERSAALQGIIALQMHQGPPMKVEFKNLRIRLLNPQGSQP
jgi:hypothetical protein